MTKLKVNCGCGFSVVSDLLHLPSEVFNAGYDHSKTTGHQVQITGWIQTKPSYDTGYHEGPEGSRKRTPYEHTQVRSFQPRT